MRINAGHGLGGIVVATLLILGCADEPPRPASGDASTPRAGPAAQPATAAEQDPPAGPQEATFVDGRTVRVGERYHISGCENGELVLMAPNVWRTAQQTGIVFQLSGTSRSDECSGAVVEILDLQQVQGRWMTNIRSVVNGREGWISELFIGKSAE